MKMKSNISAVRNSADTMGQIIDHTQ